MQIGESLPYRFSTKFLEQYMEYINKYIYDRMQTKLYFGSVWLKIGIA
jgi:hypothetical protein